jgi:hypothetical protein
MNYKALLISLGSSLVLRVKKYNKALLISLGSSLVLKKSIKKLLFSKKNFIKRVKTKQHKYDSREILNL